MSAVVLATFWGLILIAHACPGPHSVYAVNFGANGDGFHDDTGAVQATIDAAAAHVGASTPGVQACAVLGSGIFVSGTIYLRPGVVLYLEATAVLKASRNASLFPHDPDWPGNAALVVSKYGDNSGIAGSGVIDGQAPLFVTSLDPITDQFIFDQYQSPTAGPFRVRLVEFRHSRNVSVSGITLQDATSFHVHFLNCSWVLVEDVTVHSDLRWPSCDAIDVTSSNDTIIRRSRLTTGDDAISPKTWEGYGPLVNLHISDVVIHARSGGIHFGASAWFDYINVTVNNVQVIDSHGGMLVQVRGPGSVRGLRVTNFMVSHATFNAPCLPWMGNAHPIAISADRWRGGPADRGPTPAPAGSITDLSFENITAQAENGIFVSGRVGSVQRVSFSNVVLVVLQNPPNNASFGPCNAHNYWPTSGAGGQLGIPAAIDGLYIESAEQVHVEGLSVSFVGQPKPGNSFGQCVFADPNSTSGVVVEESRLRCIGGVPHGR